jgi:hypothetical protein
MYQLSSIGNQKGQRWVYCAPARTYRHSILTGITGDDVRSSVVFSVHPRDKVHQPRFAPGERTRTSFCESEIFGLAKHLDDLMTSEI